MVFLFTMLAGFNSVSSQDKLHETDVDLNLKDTGQEIENSIKLYITGKEYNALKTSKGRKINLNPQLLIINKDSIAVEKIRTRGHTTLFYPRKSLSFSLESPAELRHREKGESLRKFYALSLSMDRNYCNNRLAFELMEISGIFELFSSFCELSINDHCEGIYLIVERPEDWALKKRDSPLLIRRGYNHEIEKITTTREIDKSQIKKYCSCYNNIYKCLNKYEGEELFDTISNWLDLDLYMKWLAFNFFVRNGDYTDEVYFYLDPSARKFKIIPWDYDDIFFSEPHEGYQTTSELTKNKYIFSAEDLLDQRIASDPYLYKIYLGQLVELLNQLPADVLKAVFENTYADLYPYYSDNEIIKMSEYDAYKNANFERLENDMFTMYSQLRFSREIYLKNLRKTQSGSDSFK